MTPAKKTASTSRSAPGFSEAERAAMKERADELKAEGRGGKKKADDANAALAKIAEMSQPDRGFAERIHAIITTTAPELSPKTWYGMPAYAKDGKLVCFFQASQKFETRYSTLGFEQAANLDDGTMWPTAYAITDLKDAEVKKIKALIKRAVS
jgi:uncharacterized protein YdhG (YjbR/CyaY superfamily)